MNPFYIIYDRLDSNLCGHVKLVFLVKRKIFGDPIRPHHSFASLSAFLDPQEKNLISYPIFRYSLPVKDL